MVFLSSNLSRLGAQLQLQAFFLHVTASSDTVSTVQTSWTLTQIAAPIIVGVALIILFSAYITWQKSPPLRFWVMYHYHQIRDAFISIFTRVFTPQHHRHEVQHVSVAVTLDDSMIIPYHIRRHHASDSADSQSVLTGSSELYYPPCKYVYASFHKPILGASQQPERRRPWRWWRLLGIGPQEVKSQIPNHRFRVEGPDESSVGHEDTQLNNPDIVVGPGWSNGLTPLREQTTYNCRPPSQGFYDRVIQIGDPQFTANSTHMIPAYIKGVAMRVASGSAPISSQTAPENISVEYLPLTTMSISRTITTAPTSFILQSSCHTPKPTLSDLPAPQMYSSVSHFNHAPMEGITDPARSNPIIPYPGPVRSIGTSLPHKYQVHERESSAESMLGPSAPIVTPVIY